MDLSHVHFQHDPRVRLHWPLAIFIVIHPLLAVTLYHVPSEQADGLVRHLTLASALLDGLKILDGILRATQTVLPMKTIGDSTPPGR